MSVEGLLNKALVTSRMGSFSSALDAVKEALSLEPGSRRAHRVLAIVLMRKGDPWEAETALLATGAVADAEGVQLHAEILFRTDRHRQAIDRSREAVRLAPDSAEAHHGLGRRLHDVEVQAGGRRSRIRPRVAPEWMRHWQEAVRLAPEYLPPRVSLARHALSSGDPRTARCLIDECVAIDPGFSEARLLAGQLCWQAGDWQAAKHHAEWLLANEGSHGTALTLLNQTRLPGGAFIRPIQRAAYSLSGQSGWFYLAASLGFCAFLACLPKLGVEPSALDAARLQFGWIFGGVALVLFAVRSWPRWQAARALRAPALFDDF